MFNIQLRQGCILGALILIIFSCRKHDVTLPSGTLTLSTTAIRIDTATGTQGSVTVESTVAWTATLSPVVNWIRIDSTAGPAGKTVVRLTVLSGSGTASPRTATIIFSPVGNSNIMPVTLTVTQQPYAFNFIFRKALGGTKEESTSGQLIRLPDGGTVLVGTAASNDGDVHRNHGGSDAWVVKLNAAGDTVWTKTYGGTQGDVGNSIIATPDGGYMLAGATQSVDGDVHNNHGGYDIWLLKLNAAGDTVWTKTYGGTADDGNGFIVATNDGGYAIAGYTDSNNGDVQRNHGGRDVWLIKVNKDGALQWSQTYGGSYLDEGRSITAAPGGGFVIAGLTESNDKDVVGYHIPTFVGFDMWIVKVDDNGNKQWTRALGGSIDDAAISITAATDGYLVTGYSNSIDGDINGYHGSTLSPIFYDMMVVKLDNNGEKVWSRDFGGTFDEYGLVVAATADGGCLVAGGASSKNGDVSGYTGNGGYEDIWVIKLNGAGNKQWGKTIGGSGDDYCFSITPTVDGFMLAALSESTDGDMAGSKSHGDTDIWVTKVVVQ